MKKPELLAPAGEFKAMQGAVAAGADAVYLSGTRFGARAYAKNLTDEELLAALSFAHLRGKRIYLTLNTLIKESEFGGLKEYLEPLDAAGLDGIIVQDAGVLSFVHDVFPRIRLHASTQMAVTGPAAARFLKTLGVTRVVPARELSLKELEGIRQGTDDGDGGIEIEAFVHGAMCYSYSGMCLMSAMLGGRSGNRGRCAGACRLPYEIIGSDPDGSQFQCGEPHGSPLRSGRRRADVHRTSCAPRASLGGRHGSDPDGSQFRCGEPNRGRIGNVLQNESRKKTKQKAVDAYPLSLRDMCTLPDLQRILKPGVIDSLKIEGRMKDPVYAAGVTAVYRKAVDEIVSHPDRPYVPDEEDLRTLKGLYLRTDLCSGYYFLHNSPELITGETPGYIGSDDAVTERVQKEYLDKPPRVPVNVFLTAKVGEALTLTLSLSGDPVMTVTATGPVVERVRGKGLDEQMLHKQLDRFGESDFLPVSREINADPDAFVPASVLNSLRRSACEELRDRMLQAVGARRNAETKDRAAEGKKPGSWQESIGETPVVRHCEDLRGCDGADMLNPCVKTAYRPAHETDYTLWSVSLERPEQIDALIHVHGDACLRENDPDGSQFRCAEPLGGRRGSDPARIYLPMRAFLENRDPAWETALEKLKAAYGDALPPLYAALPYILRRTSVDHGSEDLEKLLALMDDTSADRPDDAAANGSACSSNLIRPAGLLVRNLEEAALLKEAGFDGVAEADQTIPVWNAGALATLKSLFAGWTISPELSVHEVAELLKDSGESARETASLVVYGRVPMMVSAGCILKTTGRCRRTVRAGEATSDLQTGRGEQGGSDPDGSQIRYGKPEILCADGFDALLKDRKGMLLPVSGDCRSCYNVIRNAVPLSLEKSVGRISSLGIRCVRYDLTTESMEEAEAILTDRNSSAQSRTGLRSAPVGAERTSTGRPAPPELCSGAEAEAVLTGAGYAPQYKHEADGTTETIASSGHASASVYTTGRFKNGVL